MRPRPASWVAARPGGSFALALALCLFVLCPVSEASNACGDATLEVCVDAEGQGVVQDVDEGL